MSRTFYQQLEHKKKLTDKLKLEGVVQDVKMEARLFEGVKVSFNSTKVFTWNFFVADILEPLIIGIDFLCHFKAVMDFDKCSLTLGNSLLRLSKFQTNEGKVYSSCQVVTQERLEIPPNCVLRATAGLTDTLSGDVVISSTGHNKGALLPNILVKSRETVPIQLVNDTDDTIVLQRGHIVGNAVECDGVLLDPKESIARNEESVTKTSLPEHLEGLWKRSGKSLNKQETQEVYSLLSEFQDIFSKGSHDLGCFTEIKHSINTGNEKPVKHPMRRTPIGFEGEEEENLKLMLDIGIITESSSDWASAPVLVRKRDGTVRYCVDFRSLNAKTVKDLFPLPSISQCLDQLSGNMYFSTLDMASGYWQIEIDEKDRHKTAFITKYGLFEHQRMAFGLCNAPATFQRVIQFVLRGLTWNKILAFLDDVIVLGRDFSDHLTNLRLTFERFRKYHLKLKPKKCNLFHTETTF